MTPSAEVTIELSPQARLDVIDVTRQVAAQHGDVLDPYRRALYCSYHTTAGYFEQSLCARLGHSRDSLEDYVASFQTLFPPHSDYRHDQLEYRTELSEEQKRWEPLNADSHLTFIGSGLESCVTYLNRPGAPVYFVDLDGVNGSTRRRRQTTVIGFNQEVVVGEVELTVPLSRHAIDSVNLRDPRTGLMDQIHDLLRRYGITKGRVDLSLAPDEVGASLTVNEYETMLMRHDLAEVLRNPLRYMAEQGKHMLIDPGAIPYKALNYAKYDLVLVVNKLMDKFGVSESVVERAINKFLAVPASRRLRMKRSMSLLVSDRDVNGKGAVIQGRYQSPILVQWKRAKGQTRRLNVTLVRFE